MSSTTTRGSIGLGQIKINIPSITKKACHKVNATVCGMYSFIQPNTDIFTFPTPTAKA